MLPQEHTPETVTESNAGRKEKVSPVKLAAVQYVIVGVLLILAMGLWRLQVLNGDDYRLLAEANRVHKVPILAPRGKLLDREGRLLVDNYSSVACYLMREQMRNPDAEMRMIADGLHLPLEQVTETVRHFQYAPKYQPIPLKVDITPDEQAFIEAHRNELPELELLEEQRRLYPRDGFAAHLIGYVGEISEQDLALPKYAFYEPGDVVGKSGVEQAYDSLLRGVDGSRDLIVNSHGREIGVLGEELAQPGKDLRLTIDLDVQMAAEKSLEGKNGAIVAMDPHTGEILAMVSRPIFDPNQFAVRLDAVVLEGDHYRPGTPAAEQGDPGAVGPGINVQDHHERGRAGARHCADRACELQRRHRPVRALLSLRYAPWRCGYRPCDSVVVRRVLLRAGAEAGDRHDCEVRNERLGLGRRPGSTCRKRPPERCRVPRGR